MHLDSISDILITTLLHTASSHLGGKRKMPLGIGLPKYGYDDLLQHYRDGGLDVVLLEKDSPETIGKKRAFKIGG